MSLFRSVYDALRFAYNFNGDNTVSALLVVPPAGNGKGLGGLDGAAEAGNIKRIVRSCGIKAEMLIVARFSPPTIRRVINKGVYLSLAWKTAIRHISRLIDHDCFHGRGGEEYQFQVVAKVFNFNKNSIEDISKSAGIPRSTAYEHFRLAKKLIVGFRTGKKGMLQVAIEEVDGKLCAAGIVGDE